MPKPCPLYVVFLADGKVVDELERPSADRVLEKMKELSSRTPVSAAVED